MLKSIQFNLEVPALYDDASMEEFDKFIESVEKNFKETPEYKALSKIGFVIDEVDPEGMLDGMEEITIHMEKKGD